MKTDLYTVILGKQIFLRHYKTFEDACSARAEAEIKYGLYENHGRLQINKNPLTQINTLCQNISQREVSEEKVIENI